MELNNLRKLGFDVSVVKNNDDSTTVVLKDSDGFQYSATRKSLEDALNIAYFDFCRAIVSQSSFADLE